MGEKGVHPRQQGGKPERFGQAFLRGAFAQHQQRRAEARFAQGSRGAVAIFQPDNGEGEGSGAGGMRCVVDIAGSHHLAAFMLKLLGQAGAQYAIAFCQKNSGRHGCFTVWGGED